MTQPIVPSISDADLTMLEDYLDGLTVPDERMAEVKIGELRGLIARLRAAEKDASRYRWLREFIDQSPQAIEHLPCSDGDLIDEVIDLRMEQKP